MDDVGEIGMVNRLATEGKDKGFAPVCIDVGGGITQKFNGIGHFIYLVLGALASKKLLVISNSINNQKYNQ